MCVFTVTSRYVHRLIFESELNRQPTLWRIGISMCHVSAFSYSVWRAFKSWYIKTIASSIIPHNCLFVLKFVLNSEFLQVLLPLCLSDYKNPLFQVLSVVASNNHISAALKLLCARLPKMCRWSCGITHRPHWNGVTAGFCFPTFKA